MASMVDLGTQRKNMYSFLCLPCWDSGFVHFRHSPETSADLYTTVSTLIGIVSRDRSFSLVVLIWCFLLSSNLWTTSAIAWRAWFVESHCFQGPLEITYRCLHSPQAPQAIHQVPARSRDCSNKCRENTRPAHRVGDNVFLYLGAFVAR